MMGSADLMFDQELTLVKKSDQLRLADQVTF